MEISATEIKILCNRINASIDGYSISSVYSMQEGILLRLRHETRIELLVAIASFATWLTKKNLSLSEAESIVTRIRETVERSRLLEVKQEGDERVATFKLASRSGKVHFLHAEFFGGSNLILCDENEMILEARKSERFRHRSIVRGEKFILPPARGVALDRLTATVLAQELEKYSAQKHEPNGRTREITAVRWFGRSVATSRKFVEEIFFRANVPQDIEASLLSSKDIDALATQGTHLRAEIESSTRGYLLMPLETDRDPDGLTPLDVDVSPIVTNTWRILQQEGKARVEEFENYSQALDEAQVQSYLIATRTRASREVRRQVGELDSAIRKQDSLLEENKRQATELRTIAHSLMEAQEPERTRRSFNEALLKLERMEVIEKDPIIPDQLNFAREPRNRINSFSNERAFASRLFEEAKFFEDSNAPILRVREELSRRRESLVNQAESSEERAEKRKEFERRGRHWFERYRWFLTSEKELAVGGRDATSNSIIINKYCNAGDVVFHGDIHGSPFFVLKNGARVMASSRKEDSEIEMAQATASFSRAWKEELSSADSYWIEPGQIKKSAPSGEYLARGSFFIEGRKNFVKHVKIELAIGIIASDLLDSISADESQTLQSSSSAVYPVIVCGPEKSLSSYCRAYVRIAPGSERSTAVAKKVKQLLVAKMKDDQLVDSVKKIALDDILRVMPSGDDKIIGQKQKN